MNACTQSPSAGCLFNFFRIGRKHFSLFPLDDEVPRYVTCRSCVTFELDPLPRVYNAFHFIFLRFLPILQLSKLFVNYAVSLPMSEKHSKGHISFSSHTSSCARFHQRRLSDTSALISHLPQQPSQPFINISSFANFLSSGSSSQASSPTADSSMSSELGSSAPSSFFMPTGLSLHNAFEGARRRSMSYGSHTRNN